jgi:DNA polymerase III alpha subunit
VIVPAIVQSARTIVVRNGRSAGQKMAILTIEDTTGTAEAVMFAERLPAVRAPARGESDARSPCS